MPRVVMVKRMPGNTFTATIVCCVPIVFVIADNDMVISGIVVLLDLGTSAMPLTSSECAIHGWNMTYNLNSIRITFWTL